MEICDPKLSKNHQKLRKNLENRFFVYFLNRGGSKGTVLGSVTGSLLSRMNLIDIIFMKNKNFMKKMFFKNIFSKTENFQK